MDQYIEALRQELEAARRKLSGTPADKRERLIGYISGLQVAMNVLNKPLVKLEY